MPQGRRVLNFHSDWSLTVSEFPPLFPFSQWLVTISTPLKGDRREVVQADAPVSSLPVFAFGVRFAIAAVSALQRMSKGGIPLFSKR